MDVITNLRTRLGIRRYRVVVGPYSPGLWALMLSVIDASISRQDEEVLTSDDVRHMTAKPCTLMVMPVLLDRAATDMDPGAVYAWASGKPHRIEQLVVAASRLSGEELVDKALEHLLSRRQRRIDYDLPGEITLSAYPLVQGEQVCVMYIQLE